MHGGHREFSTITFCEEEILVDFLYFDKVVILLEMDYTFNRTTLTITDYT